MATLPQQQPGPGPTDQALPSYLSYSPVASNVVTYASTITQVVYDPQGGFAPYQTLSTVRGTTTSVAYSVVNVPLLYTGPFPAPDLGTLYTTPGQVLPSTTARGSNAETGAAPSPSATATAGGSSGVSNSAAATGTAGPTSAAPTDTAASASEAPASTQDGSVTADSAPPATVAPTPSATSPTADTTNPTAAPTTAPTTTDPINGSATTSPASSLPLSSATTSNSNTSANDPSATAAGAPNNPINPQNLASKGLSGGQIAGIVLGSFFALLFLLLLLLCCLRRRRKQRQQQAVLAAATGGTGSALAANSRGNARGNYAALGIGAAAGAAGAAGRRPSLSGSDDWEEDHLTGGGSGSGFFVVGGRRLGPDRRASIASRRSQRSLTAGNVAPSSPSSSGRGGTFAGLAAAGAGFFAAALGRNKKKNRVEIEEEQQPLSDDDVGDGSMAERRGLMNPHDSPNGSGYGSGQEMREANSRVAGPAAALLAVPGGAAAAYGSRSGRGDSRPGSDALSSSAGTNSSHTQRARQGISSSNSTGGFTSSGSVTGTSLPPPPRALRSSPQQPLSTYNNVEPSSEQTNTRLSAATMDSSSTGMGMGSVNPALMGLGTGAALGGLGALAAGHRESEGSSYSRHPGADEARASHVSEMSVDELRHLRSTDLERYSRFISSGSNLLGPDYQPSPDPEADAKELGDADVAMGTMGAGGSTFQRTRLPTIRSVGEFGEKSDSPGTTSYNQSTSNRTNQSSSMHAVSANSGSLGAASAGSRGNVVSPLPQYEPHQLQAGESLPHYTFHDQPRAAEDEQIQSPISEGAGRFVTPPASPRNNTLGGIDRPSFDDPAQRYDAAEEGEGPELAEAGVASAGILGGVAAGWRRLTMGQYAWIPGTSSPPRNVEHQQSGSYRDSSGELGTDPEGRISHDQRPSEDSSRLVHHNRRASRLETSETGLAPSVRSERASVYGPSALGHTTNTDRSLPVAHLSSKEASGSSGEQQHQQQQQGEATFADPALPTAAAVGAGLGTRSHPSISSQNSRSVAGGYAASQSNSSVSGRRTIASESSGLDSLSAVAQLSSRSTGSASTRSGYRSSSRSRGSSRGGRGRRSGGLSSEASMGSGASTGAASYSPSGVLSRGNTTSTRGVGEESGPTGSAVYFPSRATGENDGEEEDEADDDGDVASGMATQGAGSGSYERKKRPRSSSGDGLSRLDSLREITEDPFGDAEAVPPVPPPAGGHYPSSSLGAAVSRSAARDADTVSYLRSNPLPQRSRIRSLQPGTSAPAPTALAPSLSTPSLSSSSSNPNLPPPAAEPAPQETMHSRGSGSLSSIPASASWRPSPRVASAAQRAAEAQAALLRQQQGGPTPPRSYTASPSAGATYNWADLDTTFRSEPRSGRRQPSADLEGARGQGEEAGDEEDKANKSFEWPKFLRF